MMHKEQMQFAEYWVKFFPIKSVLEFGALDINGSLRRLFNKKVSYTGVDIGPGKGVDVICRAHEYQGPAVDCVLSCEMLEHDENWKQSLQAMPKFVKKGGLLLITCAAPARPEHGTKRTSPKDAPYCGDYYRNLSSADLLSALPLTGFDILHLSYARNMMDLHFAARKIA